MKTLCCLVVLLVLALPPLSAQDSSSTSAISYAKLGFSLTPPESTQPGVGLFVMAFLPLLHGFSPNVSVMVDPFPSTLQDYDRKMMQTEFKREQLTAISQEVQPDHLLYEYHGIMDGKNLHFYARALKRNDAVYLITATDLEQDWPADRDTLIHSVASFVFTAQHP
jgi:hypothetical protein